MIAAPENPWAVGTPAKRAAKQGPAFGVAGTSPFDGAGKNLLSTQINPIDSRATTTATGQAGAAANKLANFTVAGYQPVAAPNYATGTAALGQGNTQLQSQAYNYGGANAKFDQAGATLAGARGQATSALQGAQGLGLSAYTGGGAAHADTGALNAGLDEAHGFVGPQFAQAGDTGQARALTLQQLQGAANGPDRGQLAARNLALLESQSNPGYQSDLRAVGQKSAALGRRGSAIVNQDLGTVQNAHDQRLSDAREAAAIDAAGQTVNDRLNVTNAGLGVTQGFGSEDRAGVNTRLAQSGQLSNIANSRFAGDALNANLADSAAGRAAQGAQAYASNQRGIANDLYGFGADAAGQQTQYGNALAGQEGDRVGLGITQANGQRTYGNDLNALDSTRFGNAQSEATRGRADEYNQQGVLSRNADQFHSYMGAAQNQDANNRNELRTERGYQTQRSDQAVQDERNRLSDEEMLRNGVFNRGMGYAAQGNGAPSPAGAYQNAANTAQGQANQTSQGLGDLIAQYTASRRRSGAGTGTPPPTYSGGTTYA